MHPPSLLTVVGWIKAAWSDISEASIRCSFRSFFLEENADLALWRHEEYEFHFQRLVFKSDIADSHSHVLLLDGNSSSGMGNDDDDDE
ncbi:unnamed protein product [Hyaloperonospora brassicae]|uniref:DDE-1 domain-containing protein n=1 Tax=Hyaloperonospora brassicae TaxID=162125 RepID=A0AAV0U4B0_HYABA|nr:unnamed protein product [Hyaloperonospora brassicae]